MIQITRSGWERGRACKDRDVSVLVFESNSGRSSACAETCRATTRRAGPTSLDVPAKVSQGLARSFVARGLLGEGDAAAVLDVVNCIARCRQNKHDTHGAGEGAHYSRRRTTPGRGALHWACHPKGSMRTCSAALHRTGDVPSGASSGSRGAGAHCEAALRTGWKGWRCRCRSLQGERVKRQQTGSGACALMSVRSKEEGAD